MKKFVIYLSMFITFILLIGEFEEITFSIISIKLISLFYLWLVAKVNNYFYQGEEYKWKNLKRYNKKIV